MKLPFLRVWVRGGYTESMDTKEFLSQNGPWPVPLDSDIDLVHVRLGHLFRFRGMGTCPLDIRTFQTLLLLRLY